MLPKIRYRLVYNYAGRLNRDGRAPVAVEARQDKKKCYFSTRVLLTPDQWEYGKVINHENAGKLTTYLTRRMHELEEIELDALLSGRQMSLYQLKTAVHSGVRSNATLGEFVDAVIEKSSRGKTTKQGYRYLVNDIRERYGKLTLEDVTYDFIERYRNEMRGQGLSENTIKGRLKLLRCLVNEAIKRNLITDDPFKFVTIGNMTARVGYLEAREVRRLERMELTGKEAVVRDLFLFSCYTGLRWGDLSSLEEAEIKGGILRKTMKKTHHEVCIPVDKLFWGRPREILDRYPDITKLSHVCCGTTANRMIKDISTRAGIKKNVYFHLGRKTCSNMLNVLGMVEQDITAILGHTKSEVTRRHYLFNQSERLGTSVGRIFKNKSKTDKIPSEK